MNLSRRSLGKLALAALPVSAAQAKIDSTFDGVMVGAQTYSFRDRSLDDCLTAMQQLGLGFAELSQGHLVPKDPAAAKAWRTNPPFEQIQTIRNKFDRAGIVLYAANYSFRKDFTDTEIENGFKVAKALGLDKITASSNVSAAARIDGFAQQYKIYVAMHDHDSMKQDEFSTPDDFANAMQGRSKYIKINLDIGHFTAANFDPVSFLKEHHDDILALHIKDRKRDHGANVPFGAGDTKIKDVLQVLKSGKYPIPALIEYEYGKPGSDTVADVRQCLDYVKQAIKG